MNAPKPKLKKKVNRAASKEISVNQFAQRWLNNKKALEVFMDFSQSLGYSRVQVVSQLYSLGVYPSQISA